MMEGSKPFLRWAGSKRKLLPRLVPMFAPGFDRYVEPFMGSAVLFFALGPPSAVLGDLNPHLVETFIVVRDDPDRVYVCLERLAPTREGYYAVRRLDPSSLTPEQAAARFIFLNRFCFNGLYRTNLQGQFNVPFGPGRSGQLPTSDELRVCAKVLQGAQIVCGDFEALVRNAVKPGDFVYLDPPYAVSRRRVPKCELLKSRRNARKEWHLSSCLRPRALFRNSSKTRESSELGFNLGVLREKRRAAVARDVAMELFQVTDIHFSEVLERDYHLAVFASGYEERCTNVAEQVDRNRLLVRLLLGFAEHAASEQRIANTDVLRRLLDTSEIMIPAYDETPILEALRRVNFRDLSSGRELRVLVDYSSMSRFWYAAIVNYFRTMEQFQSIRLTFMYTVGEHQEYALGGGPRHTNVVINDILSVPGFEGAPIRSESTVGVFGLGFEWALPLGVFEKIEPDVIFAFYADPGAFSDYPGIAREQNAEFIREHVKDRLYAFPLRSVDTTYRRLAEIIFPFLEKSNITLVPMGPKPHVLAALLLASKFEEVSLLHAPATRRLPEMVRSSRKDDIVVTDVLLVDAGSSSRNR